MNTALSLIVATMGRTHEVAELLESLAPQQQGDVEVVIVDQNGDARLDGILAPFMDRIRIVHLHSEVRNNSHARNLGIRAAQGAVIGFPDDDCVYKDGVVQRVLEHFAARPELLFLTGRAVTAEGAPSSGRWAEEASAITPENVWTRLIEFSFFIRRPALESLRGFDEELGIGGRFGACEGPDLALRLLALGPGWYDPGLEIIHPDKKLTRASLDRAFRYGAGMGRVLRKHHLPWRVVGVFLVRPMGGVVLNMLRGRQLEVAYYWRTFCGRLSGYRA